MSQTRLLIELHDRTKFKIPGLENSYRNLQLIRVTDCSAAVSGERKVKVNDKDVWLQIPLSYTISPYTVVEVI